MTGKRKPARRPVGATGGWLGVVVALAAGLMAQATTVRAEPATPVAEGAPAEAISLAGRWVSGRFGFTVDIVSCGQGWCGVRVGADGACGDLALRLEPAETMFGSERFAGIFDRRAGADRHAVQGHLYRPEPGAPLTFALTGEPGERLQPMRRTFPYQDEFRLAGAAVCRVENKTSELRSPEYPAKA